MGTPPSSTSTSNIPSATNTANSNNKFPGDAAHTIFLTGKVTLQDGSSPDQPVLIERVCTGRPHPEGYTDAKGSFSIRLGQEMDVLPDASETQARNQVTANNPLGGMRDSQLASCELRAVLAGFRSEIVQLAMHRYMDNPDIGTIVLRRLGAVEGLTLSATSSLAPKEAHKAYERGMELMRKPKLEEAEKEFQKAVEIYPRFAAAWYELGRILERRQRMDEARNAYAQSIAADSKYLRPYEQLYVIAFHEKNWQELLDTTSKVMRLDPYDYPAAYYYNAVANLQLHNLGPAEKSARQSIAMDVQHENPQGMYVLGMILAAKRDYAGAAQTLRDFLKAAPDAKDADAARKQLVEISQLQAQAQAKAEAVAQKP